MSAGREKAIVIACDNPIPAESRGALSSYTERTNRNRKQKHIINRGNSAIGDSVIAIANNKNRRQSYIINRGDSAIGIANSNIIPYETRGATSSYTGKTRDSKQSHIINRGECDR